MNYPKMEFKGNTFYQIGCKKCGEGYKFDFFHDGKQRFILKCECGHIEEILKKKVIGELPKQEKVK